MTHLNQNFVRVTCLLASIQSKQTAVKVNVHKKCVFIDFLKSFKHNTDFIFIPE